MPRYPNGRIPFDVLVHLGGEHYLTPGTASKWAALQADVLANEGVLLQISPGANGYRWYEKQEEAYEDSAPGDAAYPGTSSHGGEYQGRDSMAIDVGNWGQIGMDKFYSYARKHGFEPGFFDWEPWHIIDWDPWAAVPASNPINSLGDEMTLRIIESPFYRAAGYRVIHNGSAAMSVVAGHVQDMILRGHVDFCPYDDDNLLETEVRMVWQLGGYEAGHAAQKTTEMFEALKKDGA